MTTYLAYAKRHKEFEVADALMAMDIAVYCPRKIEFRRTGKKRRAEAIEMPYLDNYLFVELSPERFLEALGVKHLAQTLTPLSRRDMRSLGLFRCAVDEEYERATRIADNKALISQYRPGQALTLLDGRFSDHMLHFKAMVERAHDLYPKVQMETHMMGRTVVIEADPLDVKAV